MALNVLLCDSHRGHRAHRDKSIMTSVFEKFKEESYHLESIVWRYLDFSKFVDMLDSKCLFFVRLSKLREFDPYEGSIVPFVHQYEEGKSSKIIRESDEGFPNECFVSCWYLSDIESAALWKLFLKSNEGIAIKSTVCGLSNSIATKNSEKNIWMGSVAYGYEEARRRVKDMNSGIPGDYLAFTKRKCFEHEKELRLAIFDDSIPANQEGVKIKIDLNSMISEIIVGPEAPVWMERLVKRVLKKYGFHFEVRKSFLNQLTV